jgi:ribonuclease R
MGDEVKIKVVAANLEKRQLDYEWVPGNEKLDAKKSKLNEKKKKK